MQKRLRLPPPTLELLNEVESYLERTGVKRTTFGLEAVGDGHFIRRLEQGREPRHETKERARGYMARTRR